MRIVASAPNKVHLCGEHSVVYGGWAILAPVEVEGKRNMVALDVQDGDASLVFSGNLGTATLNADGSMTGDEVYFFVLETAKFIFQKTGLKKKVFAVLDYGGSPKGTGNSASIPAALAMALYAAAGVHPSKTDLYDAAFVADNVVHGMKSSGGDVQGVVSSCPQKFRKIFNADGSIATEYVDEAGLLPAGTCLVLVDSFRGGEKGNTGALVAQFAVAHGISKKPLEMSDVERKAVYGAFDSIVGRMEQELNASGDAVVLGKLFDENHVLLQSVTVPDIDEAIALGKKNGALGGKLIGAGGVGGAVLLLCWDVGEQKIVSELQAAGFKAWKISFATEGPKLH